MQNFVITTKYRTAFALQRFARNSHNFNYSLNRDYRNSCPRQCTLCRQTGIFLCCEHKKEPPFNGFFCSVLRWFSKALLISFVGGFLVALVIFLGCPLLPTCATLTRIISICPCAVNYCPSVPFIAPLSVLTAFIGNWSMPWTSTLYGSIKTLVRCWRGLCFAIPSDKWNRPSLRHWFFML